MPHNWEAGYLFDDATHCLLCGDIFTHDGHDAPPTTTSDLVGPSDALRRAGIAAGQPDSYSLGCASRSRPSTC